jgi:predicted AAA+ superfamily ATPase
VDGVNIFTPWGYIAWQLGRQTGYNFLAEEDQKRVAPGNDTLRKLIGSEATLILLDEFLVFVGSRHKKENIAL